MKQKLKTAAKSILIIMLIFLVVIMMVQIERLKGTARVINYAGLVRGATQREVKLEITGNKNDDLIKYLDDILSGLKYEEGHYNLVSIKDENYQQKLDVQIEYWHNLKEEIIKVRQNGYENTDVVEMSEKYFALADETVSAAEKYSEKIVRRIRYTEFFSAADIILMIFMLINQTLSGVKIAKKNKMLEHKAYIDVATGLPNKSRCEELLKNKESIENPVACVMFDLNNLKKVNDALGHSVGDQLILNFARILRNSIPAVDFVGRYGGDEFIAVIYDATEEKVKNILDEVQREVDYFNSYGKNVEISFASGWAVSSEYVHCTMLNLFDEADKYMYENKQKRKLGRQD